MAEGMFIHLVKEAKLSDQITIDSAGTSGWHEGAPADARMQQTARAHGIALPSRSRQVKRADFERFDYIIPMDQSNVDDLIDLQATATHDKAQVIKMRYFDSLAPNADVPDPYYGGQQGFEDVYQMIERSCRTLLYHITTTHKLTPRKA